MDSSGSSALKRGSVFTVFVAAALSLAVAISLAAPMQAHAKDIEFMEPELWAGNTYGVELYQYLDYNSYNGTPKLLKVKSSNSSILYVKKIDSNKTLRSYEVYPKKPGKAKLSVTYKLNGKKKTAKHTFRVRKAKIGITSVLINGEPTTIPTSEAALTDYDIYGFKDTSVTLNVGGWFDYLSINSGDSVDFDKFQNGMTFSIPKGEETTISILMNTSSINSCFEYGIHIHRCLPVKLKNGTLYAGHPKASPPDYEYVGGESGSSVEGSIKDVVVTAVTSSNPKVIEPVSNKDLRNVRLQPKKVGKSTITITYSVNGKTYTASATYKVEKFPLKSVKVNGKKINLKKYADEYALDKYSKNNAKVKITPAKGWKIKSINYSISSYEMGYNIKNGSSFSTPKNQFTWIDVDLKKGKQKFRYLLEFNRKG